MAKKLNKGRENPEKKRRENPEKEARMALSKRNYVMMLAGLAAIVVGFVLMSGGGSDDPAVFNSNMFSFRRITLAPIVVVAGFAFEIFAIMWRPKGQEGAQNETKTKV